VVLIIFLCYFGTCSILIINSVSFIALGGNSTEGHASVNTSW